MNVALGAFIILLLLIPSITFKFALSSNNELKVLTTTNTITDTFWLLSFIPLFIHLLLITFIWACGYVVKFDLILSLLRDKNDLPIIENIQFHKDIQNFLIYLIIATILGFFLGKLIVKILIKKDSDGIEKVQDWFAKLIGSHNDWYRLFNGNVVDYGEKEEHRDEIDLIYLDILAKNGDKPILYSGLFVNYYLKDGTKQLESIVIQNAFRRHIIQTVDTGNNLHFSEPDEIPGDYFIIPFIEISNLNISYLTLKDWDDIGEIDELDNEQSIPKTPPDDITAFEGLAAL